MREDGSMKLSILGGTGWLGGHIAREALERGHEVTCVARGTDVPEGVTFVHADRDGDDALAPVAADSWDGVIDVAMQPGHVRRAVRDLAQATQRYIFVSSVSAYPDHSGANPTESAPVFEPLESDTFTDMAEYGAAKVACENAARERLGSRTTIVRPGLIGGPGDPSARSTYWPLRFASPSNPEGAVLVPDHPDFPTSVIDVRDLAEWLVNLAELGSEAPTGPFNAVGMSTPLAQHLTIAREVAGFAGSIVVKRNEWLRERGVSQWAGTKSLPLWIADDSMRGFGAWSNARALEAGLALRPLQDTLRDGLEWALAHSSEPGVPSGLTQEQEAELLAEARL